MLYFEAVAHPDLDFWRYFIGSPFRHHDMIFFLFHNMFVFGEYVHVLSVVLKVWFLKSS